MTVVSKIWHPDGRVQFDSTWPQKVRVTKGRITDLTQTIVLPGGRNPTVAFRPINCNACIERQQLSGTTFSYDFVKYQYSAGHYIDYWIYDRVPPGKPTSKPVHALFDEAENTTFSTEQVPMRYAKQATQPAGKIYAIAPWPGPYWQQRYDDVENSHGGIDIVRTAEMGGWVFNGSSFSIQSFGTPTDFDYSADGSYTPGFFLIDVTNH